MKNLLHIVFIFLSIVIITSKECIALSPLPEFNNITEITFYNYKLQYEIKFPQSEFKTIYYCFENIAVDPKPAKWVYIGELRFKDKDDRVIPIAIFKDESGPFSINRVYYQGANFLQLNEIINKYKPDKN